MSISLENAAELYLVTKKLSSRTCKEYRSTVTKWTAWGKGVDVDQIGRVHLRDFLDWVYEKAAGDGGSNAGRTANKARENLRAILSWAWEQDFVEKLPRFPKPKPQRDVAGRHYLTKSDLNSVYFATYQLPRPRGWKQSLTVGHYWRAALVVFFNYGVDTGTVFKSAAGAGRTHCFLRVVCPTAATRATTELPVRHRRALGDSRDGHYDAG
jgi:hypothetical protein